MECTGLSTHNNSTRPPLASPAHCGPAPVLIKLNVFTPFRELFATQDPASSTKTNRQINPSTTRLLSSNNTLVPVFDNTATNNYWQGITKWIKTILGNSKPLICMSDAHSACSRRQAIGSIGFQCIFTGNFLQDCIPRERK